MGCRKIKNFDRDIQYISVLHIQRSKILYISWILNTFATAPFKEGGKTT